MPAKDSLLRTATDPYNYLIQVLVKVKVAGGNSLPLPLSHVCKVTSERIKIRLAQVHFRCVVLNACTCGSQSSSRGPPEQTRSDDVLCIRNRRHAPTARVTRATRGNNFWNIAAVTLTIHQYKTFKESNERLILRP